jgi:hypothetical protein
MANKMGTILTKLLVHDSVLYSNIHSSTCESGQKEKYEQDQFSTVQPPPATNK